MLEDTTIENPLENVQERIAKLKTDLQIEKILYANMHGILKKREEEINRLYDIIFNLMNNNK